MTEQRRAVAAWGAGVSAVAAAFAGILTSRATTPLSQNSWFIACLVIALITFLISLCAVAPDIAGWLRPGDESALTRTGTGRSVLEAGEVASTARAWSLAGDPEAVRHWRPRARGVSVDSERGYRFRGRSAALETITGWLDRGLLDRRVLVVTGAPGSGKSAVLGRIVTTADLDTVEELPSWDKAVRASPGSVACAVHAQGKTALEVAVEIARAASAALPGRVKDFAPAMRAALAKRGGRRFNVIIDALDETDNAEQARTIITEVLLPLAETCSDVGAQLVVGSRRRDDNGDLLAFFGESATVVDLDEPRFFSVADLAAYTQATLQLAGDERAGNPYADNDVASAVAGRIAELSGGNFLVAGLIARTHGMHDERAVDPARLSFTATVDTAMHDYLQRLFQVAGVQAEAVLMALAFAEAPGIPVGLWRAGVRALGAGDITATALTRFARSSAANFLVESSGQGGQEVVFRLFHQALNDALLRARAQFLTPAEDERVLSQAFAEFGRQSGWERAPRYLLRSLPGHAARGGVIDDLLTDDAYLLHADLRRLVPFADGAVAPDACRRAQMLRLTPQALTADPQTRAALFSVTEALENIGHCYGSSSMSVPYHALWAVSAARGERAIITFDHDQAVWAMCAIEAGDVPLLATGHVAESPFAKENGTVRLWNAVTGAHLRTLTTHSRFINAMCTVPDKDQTLLAIAGGSAVRLWDLDTCEVVHTVTTGGVHAMCAIRSGPRTLLATTAGGNTVRLWNPATGKLVHTLTGDTAIISSPMCTVPDEDQTLLAIAGDSVVRLWDPDTGEVVHIPTEGWIKAMCAIRTGRRTLLATASGGGTVRLWDSSTGDLVSTLATGGEALCAVQDSDRTLLATLLSFGVVRLWDLASGACLQTLPHEVKALCSVRVGGRALLAAASSGIVRLWDPADSGQPDTVTGHDDGVTAACAIQDSQQNLLATASRDGKVRLRDAPTGDLVNTFTGHNGQVTAMCSIPVHGQALLPTTSGGTARLWNPVTGTCLHEFGDHAHKTSKHYDFDEMRTVGGVCTIRAEDQTLLAASSPDDPMSLL